MNFNNLTDALKWLNFHEARKLTLARWDDDTYISFRKGDLRMFRTTDNKIRGLEFCWGHLLSATEFIGIEAPAKAEEPEVEKKPEELEVGFRSYHCIKCDAFFRDQKTLFKHLDTVHADKSELDRVIEQVHNGQYKTRDEWIDGQKCIAHAIVREARRA